MNSTNMSSTILGTGDIAVNNSDKNHCLNDGLKFQQGLPQWHSG